MILSFSPAEQALLACFAFLVLVFPGAAVILWTPSAERDPLERFADSVGLSIAITAVLGMLFFYLKIPVGPNFLMVLLAAAVMSVLAAALLGRLEIPRRSAGLWVVLGLVLLFSLAAWRFYQARTLVFPAWVDSIHHVLVTQKIIDARGVPGTLGPELDVPFFYHFGFHIVAAVFSAVSRLQPDQAVLWIGQVINALLSLGIYRLVKSIWRDARRAGVAALLVGIAFQMPAYYLTWGRYTLLTGLLLMVLAMASGYELIFRRPTLPGLLRLGLLTAGLALTHYMALFFLALFLAAAGLLRLFSALLQRRKASGEGGGLPLKGLWWAAAASVGGVLLALPWLVRMLSALASQARVQVVMPGSGQLDTFRYILYLIGPTYNHILMGLAVLGLLLAWMKTQDRPLAFWGTLLALLALPWGLRLGPFRPDHMAIVLFVPAAAFLAHAILSAGDFLARRTRKWAGTLLWLVLSLAALAWGGWHTRSILNPVTVLADRADQAALEWVDRSLPQEVRFFANTTHWQFGAYRGVDGGYWLIPNTRRFSIALPALYAYAERVQVLQWRDWMETASQITTCDQVFWDLAAEARLTHVYLHAGRGSLQYESLANCEGFRLLYQSDGVSILEIVPLP